MNTATHFQFTGTFQMSCQALLINIQYCVQIWIRSQGLLPAGKTIQSILFRQPIRNNWTLATYKAQPWIFVIVLLLWNSWLHFFGACSVKCMFFIESWVKKNSSTTAPQDTALLRSVFHNQKPKYRTHASSLSYGNTCYRVVFLKIIID